MGPSDVHISLSRFLLRQWNSNHMVNFCKMSRNTWNSWRKFHRNSIKITWSKTPSVAMKRFGFLWWREMRNTHWFHHKMSPGFGTYICCVRLPMRLTARLWWGVFQIMLSPETMSYPVACGPLPRPSLGLSRTTPSVPTAARSPPNWNMTSEEHLIDNKASTTTCLCHILATQPSFKKPWSDIKSLSSWSVTTVSCSSCRCMTLTCCGIPTSCDLSTTLGIWRRSWALSWIMMIPRRIDPRDRNWARPQRPQRECGPMPIPASPTSPMAHSTEGRTRKVFYTKWQKNKKNVYLIILTKSTWYLCLWLVWVRSTKSKARYHINIGAKYIHTISLNFLDPEWVPMRCGRIKNYSSSWCPPIIYSALWSWNCRKMIALGESLENRYQKSK